MCGENLNASRALNILVFSSSINPRAFNIFENVDTVSSALRDFTRLLTIVRASFNVALAGVHERQSKCS
jgi:hypothetical protein